MLRVCTVASTMAFGSIAHAQFVFGDSFDTSSNWSFFSTQDASVFGTIYRQSNGNPGGHYQIGLRTRETPGLLATGLLWFDEFDLSSFASGRITLRLDYSAEGLFPNTATPELSVFLYQDNRMYYERDSFLQTTLLEDWVTLPTQAVDIADLSNSSGIPLDLDRPVRIGIAGFREWDGVTRLQMSYSIDNVRIEVVPTPASTAVVISGLVLTGRRRR